MKTGAQFVIALGPPSSSSARGSASGTAELQLGIRATDTLPVRHRPQGNPGVRLGRFLWCTRLACRGWVVVGVQLRRRASEREYGLERLGGGDDADPPDLGSKKVAEVGAVAGGQEVGAGRDGGGEDRRIAFLKIMACG